MYTKEQIGPIELRAITTKSKDRYEVLVRQDEYFVPVMTGADWHKGCARAQSMILAGVDPTDIFGHLVPRGVEAGPQGYEPENPYLYDPGWGSARHHLWWTIEDEYKYRRRTEGREAADAWLNAEQERWHRMMALHARRT